MNVTENIFDENLKGCVLTIGNFDGVHIGHQAILAAARQTADKLDTCLVVMTFHPHPLAVVRPQNAPPTLTPLPLKQHLLAGHKVDSLIVLRSAPAILSLPPQTFIEEYAVAAFKPACIVEGDDFNFGAARTGDIDTLKTLGKKFAFQVIVVPSKTASFADGKPVEVSSTMVRRLLAASRVSDAAVLLGRPYRLIGPVVPGHGRGRRLGFPTANLARPDQLVPAEAVYAGLVHLGRTLDDLCKPPAEIPAAFSIGPAPTFSTGSQLVEAHILTENVPDLTGKFMAMDFIQYLRPQQKFPTEAALVAQIAKDCQKAKEILKSRAGYNTSV